MEDPDPRPWLVAAGGLGKQVWLTTATPEGHELSVLAVDRDAGRVLFDVRVFEVARPEDTRQYNSFASPTPVIEEGRGYVHFGRYGTAALDTRTGKVLWERRDLPCNHWRGPGSLGEGGVMATPAIAGQAIFLRTESHL